jgi:uncharacterized protein (UPF0216 family)
MLVMEEKVRRNKMIELLTDEQKSVVHAHTYTMDMAVGNCITGLEAAGMNEYVAIKCVASLLITSAVGLLRENDIASDDALRKYVQDLFSRPRQTMEEIDREANAIISERNKEHGFLAENMGQAFVPVPTEKQRKLMLDVLLEIGVLEVASIDPGGKVEYRLLRHMTLADRALLESRIEEAAEWLR